MHNGQGRYRTVSGYMRFIRYHEKCELPDCDWFRVSDRNGLCYLTRVILGTYTLILRLEKILLSKLHYHASGMVERRMVIAPSSQFVFLHLNTCSHIEPSCARKGDETGLPNTYGTVHSLTVPST